MRALRRAEGVQRAAVLHQAAVLIDDHTLPTHDEMAWRAAVAAFRASPGEVLYRRQAVFRTVLRTPWAQLPRSLANLLLYLGLLVLAGGKRFKPLLVVLLPIALPALVPGVLLHLLTQAVVRPLSRALGRLLSRRLLARPEDDGLDEALRTTVAEAAGGAPPPGGAGSQSSG